MNIELNKNTEVKSVTIVKADSLSPAERVRRKLSRDEFIEVMVTKNSPLIMNVREIRGKQKPTDGFKESIKNSGFINKKFNF
ncbi:MAG: hypothetical protein WC511_04725 [Candidatus Pacearchaeota archaeon]|jgi:hypothetical protein